MAAWADACDLQERDSKILDELAHARMLSTAQLAQLGGKPEALGAHAARLARLTREGWLGRVPQVPSPSGAVTAWYRSDAPVPKRGRPALAAELIRLNALYAALRTGPNPVIWQVQPGAPVSATLQLRGKRLHLFWATQTAEARAACLRFGGHLRDPERGDAGGSDDEALLLCGKMAERDALRREVERVRGQLPGGPSAVHVSLFADAVRVLRGRLHGGRLPVPTDLPEVQLTADERAQITQFLNQVL